MMLANNNRHVILPLAEPTHGTRQKSQVQTFLDFNQGPGVQHVALKTDDIFRTVRMIRGQTASGGMEFMSRAPDEYYRCGHMHDCLCIPPSRHAAVAGVSQAPAQRITAKLQGVLLTGAAGAAQGAA